MDCKKAKSLFSDYLDETMTGESRELFEQHLRSCKDCDAQFNALLDSWEVLQDYEVPELDSDFTNKVLIEIDQRKNENSSESIFSRILTIFAWKNFAPVPAFASLLIFAGIGYVLLTGGPNGVVDPGTISNPEKVEIVRNLKDEEIIKNLEIYENADMLENLDLLVDLEAVENFETEK